MSKLKSNDGIACDICNTQFSKSFVYYNYDFVKILINESVIPSVFGMTKNVEFQRDVCENCHDSNSLKIVNNNKSRPRYAVCELSGSKISNDFAYYVFVTKLTVNLNKQKPVSRFNDYLSFLISKEIKKDFEKISNVSGSWESKS